MKESGECPKCNHDEVQIMSLRPNVAIDFGTYHLGDQINPKMYICLGCGFSEIWIDDGKQLEDLRKYAASLKKE